MNKGIELALSYTEYRPKMQICFKEDYQSYRTDQVAEIRDVNGFDKQTGEMKQPRDLFFITTDDVKVTWNEVPVLCYIERNETTSFIDSMFDYYEDEAKVAKEKNDWSEFEFERYLEEKYNVLHDVLVKYEHERVER